MNLEVIVFKRPNMFNVQENLYNLIGYQELKNLFTIENYKASVDVTLYYPERFLNILEQRDLVKRAKNAGFKSLKVYTHSVYIIQTVSSDNIKVVCDADIPEDGRFKLSNDDSGMPHDGGIGVLFGN